MTSTLNHSSSTLSEEANPTFRAIVTTKHHAKQDTKQCMRRRATRNKPMQGTLWLKKRPRTAAEALHHESANGYGHTVS
jgi:hypothetical protein